MRCAFDSLALRRSRVRDGCAADLTGQRGLCKECSHRPLTDKELAVARLYLLSGCRTARCCTAPKQLRERFATDL